MYCDWPQLGRCCFCMPLRRGLLTFGYIQLIFSAVMICMYSYSIIHTMNSMMMDWLISGRFLYLPAEICLAFYCLDMVFDGLLIYGTHNSHNKKGLLYLKAFYYYTMMSCLAMLILEIVDATKLPGPMFLDSVIALLTFSFTGLCLQIYLITLVRSLIRKLEISGPHVYDNQLHQIVSAEPKLDSNGIYNHTTVVPTDV